MNTYGVLLRKLIDFTNVKISIVAKGVGYDVSYISKWCSKSNLPTAKNYMNINKKMSELLANEIIENSSLLEFCNHFNVSLPTNIDSEEESAYLKNKIEQMLREAYENSQNKQSEKIVTEDSEGILFLTEKNEIKDYLLHAINNALKEARLEVDIICTIDICKILSNMDIESCEIIEESNADVRIKIGFDFNAFELDSDHYLKQLYIMINKYCNYEFEIFNNYTMDKLNILIVKNVLVMLCSLSAEGIIESASIITEKSKVNKAYKKYIGKFKANDSLVRVAEPDEMNTSGYRTDFYSRNEFQFFCTNGFEFLLPPKIIDSIIETAKHQNSNDAMPFLLKRIQITWEEVFEKGKIDFFILKSTIMKYIEDGKMFYTDIIYEMTEEQRKEHMKNILEITKKNENIKFFVLDDESISYPNDLIKVSIYLNNKKLFMKNHSRYQSDFGPFFYTISNEKLVLYINMFFSSLKNSNICREYDALSLEDFYKKYESMIYRFMSLKE